MSEKNNEYIDIYSHSDMEKKNNAGKNSNGVAIISESEKENVNNNRRTTVDTGRNKPEPVRSDRKTDPYEGAEEVSFITGKKDNKGNAAIKVFSVILVVLLLGAGACAAAVLTDGFGMMKKEAEPSQVSEVSILESKPESVIAEEEEAEESKEEEINFRSDAKFTKKPDRLAASVKKALDNEVQSHHVALYDVTADQIIYEKGATEKCFPASTTKLMTAVVSSKYLKKDDVITVGDEINMIGYDSSVAGLQTGMKLTYEMMLDALLLPSGNDAAYTLAVAAARAYKQDDKLENEECVKIFAELMNNAAKEMGCKGTHFTAPDGFHDDDHYVTAEDMVRISAYALNTPIVADSCRKYEATWELIATGHEDDEASAEDSADDEQGTDEDEGLLAAQEYSKEITWTNSNQLLEKDGGQYSEYATGMKTGYTDEAWTCVVSSAEIEGHKLIAVVMKSPSNYQKYHESNLLFKVGFNLYKLKYTHNDEWVN